MSSKDNESALGKRRLKDVNINGNPNAPKKRKLDSTATEQEKTIDVAFRKFVFQIPIDQNTTVAMFKNIFKSYAARLFTDFDPRFTANEHLLLRLGSCTDSGLADDVILSLMKRGKLFMDEAIAVTVDNNVYYVFQSGYFEDFKYEIRERMKTEITFFDIFKGIDHDQERVERIADLENGDGLTVREVKSKESKNKARMFVKDLKGMTVALEVDLNQTIAMLKWQLRCEWGVPGRTQRLLFAGSQLEDEKTFLEYEMMEGSTITMVLRLKGS